MERYSGIVHGGIVPATPLSWQVTLGVFELANRVLRSISEKFPDQPTLSTASARVSALNRFYIFPILVQAAGLDFTLLEVSESALFLRASVEEQEGLYCLAVPVTDDMAMARGDERSLGSRRKWQTLD